MNNSSALTADQERKGIQLMFLAVFIDLLGFGIIIPVIPYYVTDTLGGTNFEYGMILAIYSLMQFVFAPLWGRVSDRVGRKPVVLVGLLGSSISFVVFGLATTIPLLFVARMMAGFFTAASLPTARAFIADISPPEKRTARMGIIGAAFGLGFTFGPAIGSVAANFTIPSFESFPNLVPSLLAGGLALFNFFYAYLYLPETLSSEIRQTKVMQQTRIVDSFRILKYPQVGLLIALFSASTLVFSGFETIFPLYAQEVDSYFNERTIGYAFAIVGIVIIFVQAGLIRPFVRRFGEERTILAGLVFNILGLAILPLAWDRYTLILFTIPLGIGQGLLTPALNSLVSLKIPQAEQGEGLGLNSSGAAIARVVGPLIAAMIYSTDIFLPFAIYIAVFCILGIVFFLSIMRIKGNQSLVMGVEQAN